VAKPDIRHKVQLGLISYFNCLFNFNISLDFGRVEDFHFHFFKRKSQTCARLGPADPQDSSQSPADPRDSPRDSANANANVKEAHCELMAHDRLPD